jgi:predicted Rossmann-fold nucleotide-binding protein
MKPYKIGVFGSAVGATPEIEKNAAVLGEEIAKNNCILINGACLGLPHIAAMAATKKGGKTIGYTAGTSLKDHLEVQKYPSEGHTELVFVPKSLKLNKFVARKYRNVMSCDACDAGIIIGGRIGTLNEFTNLYDFGKIIGILEGSGGVTEIIKDVIKIAGKASNSVIIYEKDPKKLVKEIIKQLKSERDIVELR